MWLVIYIYIYIYKYNRHDTKHIPSTYSLLQLSYRVILKYSSDSYQPFFRFTTHTLQRHCQFL